MARHLEDLESEAPEPALARPGLLQIAWRRKSLIGLGVVTGLVLGGLYYVQRTPVYQSTAQVLVVKKRPDVIAGAETRVSYFEDYVSTHQQLVRSPLIVERAIKKRGLKGLRSFAGPEEELSERLIKAMTISRANREAGGSPSNILNLSCRGVAADECSLVLSAVIESYRDFLDETYRNITDDTLDLITQARDVLKKDLAQKEAAYSEFRQKTPLLLGKGKDGVNLHLEQLVSIETKRSALVVRRAEVQGQLNTIEAALKDGRSREALLLLLSEPARVAPADPSGRLGNESARRGSSAALQDLIPLLLEEKMLREDYGPNHPQVQSVRKRIELARELFARPSAVWGKMAESPDQEQAPKFADPVEWHAHYLKLELEQLKEAERLLGEDFEQGYEKARKLAGYEIQDQAFHKDITRTEQLYDGIVKRLQDTGLVKDFGGYDARTISPPGPGRKVEPSAWLTFPLSALLGLMGGLGLAYLAEVTDKSFRTPEEIRRRLGLPVVGHIPFIKLREDALAQAGAQGVGLDPVLCTFYRSQSAEAEAYRGVRTALYFSTRGEGHKVIQVTSPNASDGKTTLAANLAVSIAQSGKKVLLIDADLRKPRLHKLFGLSSQMGLSSVIAGQEELQDAIQSTAVSRLWVLPSGPLPPNPAELLTSPQFKALLDSIREQTKFYDFVVVDTPPLLAVTDPCVVAPYVDGVLLTIRISKNGRPPAERAKEILGTLGAKILGVVVNGVGSGVTGAYGYEQGHYGYGYGYGEGYVSGNGEEKGSPTGEASTNGEPTLPPSEHPK